MEEVIKSNNTNTSEVSKVTSSSEVNTTLNLIQRAQEVADKLKLENDRAEAILSRQILSGHSFAGSVNTAPLTQEEKTKREVDEFIKRFGK
jgi:hypothetical protein